MHGGDAPRHFFSRGRVVLEVDVGFIHYKFLSCISEGGSKALVVPYAAPWCVVADRPKNPKMAKSNLKYQRPEEHQKNTRRTPEEHQKNTRRNARRTQKNPEGEEHQPPLI